MLHECSGLHDDLHCLLASFTNLVRFELLSILRERRLIVVNPAKFTGVRQSMQYPDTHNPRSRLHDYLPSTQIKNPKIQKSFVRGGAQTRTEISAIHDPHRAPLLPARKPRPLLFPKKYGFRTLQTPSSWGTLCGTAASNDGRVGAVCWTCCTTSPEKEWKGVEEKSGDWIYMMERVGGLVEGLTGSCFER